MNNLFIINCLSTINLKFCIMTRNNERFFWSFSTAKIHILFIPTIIFHKYFSFLSSFLSIKYDLRTKIPLLLYEAFLLKKNDQKKRSFFLVIFIFVDFSSSDN